MAVKGMATAVPDRRVLQSIASASQRTGVSFEYLLNQARAESSFDPGANARTSSAAGLFQFTSQTWLSALEAHGAEHGLQWTADAIEKTRSGSYIVADPGLRQTILNLRYDPGAAAAMAGEFASDNAAYLSQQLGRSIDSTDLSLAHFLGAQGAARFLTALSASPDASAAPLFPEAAAANRGVFFNAAGAPRSLSEIHGRFAGKANAPASLAASADTMPAVQTVTRTVSQNQDKNERRSWSADLPDIEPMPQQLSLSFAQAAYRRLAAMGGGA